MAVKHFHYILFLINILIFTTQGLVDIPCARRDYEESFVCVCNETFCDEIQKFENLENGQFIMYSSGRDNDRFKVTLGNVYTKETSEEHTISDIQLVVDRRVQHQTIFGFGGAISDAAAINIKNVSKTLQKQIMNSYFSEVGIEYSILRVPIGGTDFSTHFYTYNDLPVDDKELRYFSLTKEDYDFKIPIVQEAINLASADIWLVGAVWKPPIWMKVQNGFGGLSKMNEKFYQAYAEYHLKFLNEYKREGLTFWAISTGNEPSFSVMSVPLNIQKYHFGWSPADQARWLIENLGPAIRNSIHNRTKILAVDDQRFIAPLWLHLMSWYNKTALDYIDGVAVHIYLDKDPTPYLHHLNFKYSDKFIISTEACVGEHTVPAVLYGSWKRAEKYIKDIMLDLNYNVVSWLDWNIVLNEEGGPSYDLNFVDSPIIVREGKKEIYKQPLFYVIGHFSKFIPRGSTRIENIIQENDSPDITKVTFLRPDGNIVIVLYNESESEKRVKVVDLSTSKSFFFNIHRKTLTTLIYKLENNSTSD